MKIKFIRIDHLQICIPRGEEEQAKEFYIGILGLNEIPKPEYLRKNGGFWLEIAGIQLHIGVEDQIHISKRHPAFEIKNLEAAKKYFILKGVKIRKDKPIPNYKRFSFYDPFGNRIELLGRINN